MGLVEWLRSAPCCWEEASGLRPWGERGGTSAPDPEPATPRVRAEQFSLLRSPTFWIVGASYFFISFSLYGMTTFMVDYAEHQLGFPLEKAGLLATVHGVCQVLGVLTVLPLSDILGRKKTIILSNAFITLSLTGILLSGSSWPALMFFVGLMAVFYGVTFPIYGACAGDFFPKEVMGTVIGAWTPFYGLGAILVHWVAGMLRDATGRYDLAFVITICTAAVGVALMFLVKKERS